MRISDRGLLNRGELGGQRAVSTFPSVTSLPDGTLLASYRVGSTKDSDDGTIEFRRSVDLGRTWTTPVASLSTNFNSLRGSLWLAYATLLSDQQLLLAALWVDRTAFPGRPLFNAETEGCLPMRVLLADSSDLGMTWGEWRELPVTEDIGPPSLTNPILRLPSGRLIASIETNKHYEDRSDWHQRVVYSYSDDQGKTWSPSRTTTEDPTGRIFHWDQRAGVTADGRLVTFTWTYDRSMRKYMNIRRRLSDDDGRTWTPPDDIGFADQPSHPAVLPDGRVLLAWVDRFQTGSIRTRLARCVDQPFSPSTECVLYTHPPLCHSNDDEVASSTGDLLAEMGVWTYGLPFAEGLADGSVLILHYEPSQAGGTQITWVRME